MGVWWYGIAVGVLWYGIAVGVLWYGIAVGVLWCEIAVGVLWCEIAVGVLWCGIAWDMCCISCVSLGGSVCVDMWVLVMCACVLLMVETECLNLSFDY